MPRIRKSSDSLFRLIQSLTRAEKGYFKRSMRKQDGLEGAEIA